MCSSSLETEAKQGKDTSKEKLTSSAGGRSESCVQSHDGDGTRDPLRFQLDLLQLQGPRLFALGLLLCCGGEPSADCLFVVIVSVVVEVEVERKRE